LTNVSESIVFEGFGGRSSPGACAFTPDGTLLATTGRDREVRLFDVARGAEVGVLDEHRAPVTALAFAPDGKTLATASRDQTVRLWDVAGRRVRTVLPDTSGHPLSFTADGKSLAIGVNLAGVPNAVRLFDVALGKE